MFLFSTNLEATTTPPKVGIDYEKLGTTIPMDLTFTNHLGQKVSLASLAQQRPVVLAPVYYTCTGICNPLLHAIVDLINNSPKSLKPGHSYNIISFSFKPGEGPMDAAGKRQELINSLDNPKNLPPAGWQFLTGDQQTVDRLTKAVGFHYRQEGDAFNHPAALIVVSPSGVIARYLRGLKFLPLDLMMAVTDAMEGKWAPTIKKIVKFCFVQDPQGRGYYFNFLKVAGVLIILSILITITTLTIILGRKKVRSAVEVA